MDVRLGRRPRARAGRGRGGGRPPNHRLVRRGDWARRRRAAAWGAAHGDDWGPAGRHGRPALLWCRRGQDHLRHRRLHARQQRRRTGAVEPRASLDGALPIRRECAHAVRARGGGGFVRGRDQLVQGLAWHDRHRAGDLVAGRAGAGGDGGARVCARLWRAARTALARRRARDAGRADPRARQAARRAGGARGHRPPGQGGDCLHGRRHRSGAHRPARRRRRRALRRAAAVPGGLVRHRCPAAARRGDDRAWRCHRCRLGRRGLELDRRHPVERRRHRAHL
mmetsp:Transcript_29902/g.90987  ORF Transcript_29902/g.90987 Transcript_29902/m.90987 type:complete len:281 (-) Transcript_29902:284-1126(-)